MEQVEIGAHLETVSTATTNPQAWTPNPQIFLSNIAVLAKALRKGFPTFRIAFLSLVHI